MFSRLFGEGKGPSQPDQPDEPDEPLVVVPIPPLITLLLAVRQQKGSELTEEEVLDHRDKAVCITMRLSHAQQLAEKRGYDDIDPENIWPEWQAFLADYLADEEGDPT